MEFKHFGFTLVELVLILVIIALLSAVAVPKYIEVNGARELHDKRNLANKVKSALIIARADIRHDPSVNELAAYVQSDFATAADTGVVFKNNGSVYTVPTFSDNGCTKLTSSQSDPVQCIGDTF